MAKQRAERGRRAGDPAEQAKGPAGSKPQPQAALAPARALLARGEVGAARKLLRQLAGPGSAAPEAEQQEARELLGRLGVDRGALLAAAAVALVILFALWAGLLSRQ